MQLVSIRGYYLLGLLAIAHVGAVLTVWPLSPRSGGFLVSPHVWIGFAWTWLLWPVLLALHPSRSPVRFAVPVGLGVALLTPCAQAIYAFTAWTLGGFGP